jgi:spore germination protein KA
MIMFKNISKLSLKGKPKLAEYRKKQGREFQPIEQDIPKEIETVKKLLNQQFRLCSDFMIREIDFGSQHIKVLVGYIDGYVDKNILSQSVIEPIQHYMAQSKTTSISDLLARRVISSNDLSYVQSMQQGINGILSGDAVIYMDGVGNALKVGVGAPEKRAVEEPATEVSVRGSREGFTESLKTNCILLRKKIKSTCLKVEKMKLGEQSHSEIAICYIDGIVKNDIVQEVKQRLQSIETDAILATGYIEQFIQDGKFSLFPVVGNSEKPDKVAAKLLEGRVAIIVDGTPTVLTVPYLFVESIQNTDDYYGETFFASFSRLLRVMALILSIYMPSVYVALTIFHQRAVPSKLMITMAAARQGIPFSAFVEAMVMVMVFEVLREAGIRMPKAIGQAVSIVGAIVLGDAAVSAGIASAPLIIVVALAGICSFINPPMMKIGSLLRILFLVASNMFGVLGIAVLTAMIGIYLCNKESFGIPYLTPFSPLTIEDLKDTVIMVPIWAMFTRPKLIRNPKNVTRTTGRSTYKEKDT